MNALKQYTDLAAAHRAMIDAGSAPTINALRDEALSRLESAELPRLGSENYEITDLNAILGEDYGINLGRQAVDAGNAATFRCALPTLSTALYTMANDTFAGGSDGKDAEGVTVMSLRQAAIEKPELLASLYGKCADMANPAVALNTLLAQDGLFVHIARGARPDRPVQIVNILTGAAPLMAVRRVLIVAEEDSDAQLLFCDHTRAEGVKLLNLQTVEVFARRGAALDIYDLEESTSETTRLSSLYLQQDGESRVLIDGITLCNGHTRNEYFCRFNGENAELNLFGMAIEDDDRRADNFLEVNHALPRCTSNELFKYVVGDRAKGAFSGRIYVAEGAVKTEAYQSNRNIVASDEARMYSKPQLEIYNDDVKCSHGTAIGQLDGKQLFYMRTRGIPEAEAKKLLKQAFMADVIEKVRLVPLRDRLRALVDRRFGNSDSAGCSTCATADNCAI